MTLLDNKCLEPMSKDHEQHNKLMQLIRVALKRDQELREKYQVGEKFRFVRDRLTALLKQAEDSDITITQTGQIKEQEVTADEILVYVYLYNAQGNVLQTWQKMLNASVFYEYSVNRPIYTEKPSIESLVRSKSNKMQHGYLTIVIKKNDLINLPQGETVQDSLGHSLVKVREGSLKFERFVSFVHNDNEYKLSERGELVKRS